MITQRMGQQTPPSKYFRYIRRHLPVEGVFVVGIGAVWRFGIPIACRRAGRAFIHLWAARRILSRVRVGRVWAVMMAAWKRVPTARLPEMHTSVPFSAVQQRAAWKRVPTASAAS